MQAKYSIDTLLAEARAITRVQLEEGRLRSASSGLPVGRVLVLMGAIKPTQLVKAADLQRLVQAGKISFTEAAQQLQAQSSAFGAKYFAARKRKTAENGLLRIGDLLTRSGVLAESNLLDALEISIANRISVGKVLVQLEMVSEGMLLKALNLQAQVNTGEIERSAAIAELRWRHRANQTFHRSEAKQN